MAKSVLKKIGVIDCLACGHPTPLKEAASGRLSAHCDWCDFSPWTPPGAKCGELLRQRARLDPAPAEASKGAAAAPIAAAATDTAGDAGSGADAKQRASFTDPLTKGAMPWMPK